MVMFYEFDPFITILMAATHTDFSGSDIRPEYKPSATEEQIFDAALEVFSRKGKDGARMQEIAELAGINKALLHYYFRSKDRLYDAVFSHVFRKFMTALAVPLHADLAFPDMLRSFIDEFISIHARHPEISRLWILENLSGAPVAGPALRRFLEENPDSAPKKFIERMVSGIERGEIRRVDPFHTFVTLLGASIFLFLSYPTMSVVYPSLVGNRSSTIEDRKKHVFDILYHGLAINNERKN
jgi:TetR/AcrR family transcriptional regulator